jgi:outer membrane protein insertion porin family
VVSGQARLDSGSQRIDVSFTIEEKKRSVVESVHMLGLAGVSADVADKIFKEPLIQKGMPYERAAASAEIRRVLDILANNGYPSARFDYDSSGAFRALSTGNFLLKFTFDTGRRYAFGEIAVRVEPPRDDITDNLALRQLDFQKGDLYSREKQLSSERNLNRLGLFETASVDHAPLSDSTASSLIPMEVVVRPRSRNELSPEVLVSDENNEFNLGVGLAFTNRNFLGDGRMFTARTRVRTQSISRVFSGGSFNDTTMVGAAELQFQILQPYLFTRTLSGSWTMALTADKQKFYILSILKNKIGLTKQFATYTYGSLEWTLERVRPEIVPGTPQPEKVIAALGQADQSQFNSILTLALQRDKTNDIFSPTAGFFTGMTLEESGILPKLLPGIVSGLPFTQYYKITLLGRWYRDLTSTGFNVFALKLRTGYQDKYGESRSEDVSIPLNRRFFAGGSGSIRGWRARELGAMPEALLPFGGNFIFEGSAELRVNHFRGFGKLLYLRLENIWGVYFVDFGNLWSDIADFRMRDVAVAAGIGFRYETYFGPFRIDYGVRVYDPKGPAGSQTIFKRRFLGETVSNGVFHFGIGHAF